MQIKVIKVIKQKPDYNGQSAKGPYTLKSWRVHAAIDGREEECELKTFDVKVVMSEGATFDDCRKDEKGSERGYGNVYTIPRASKTNAKPYSGGSGFQPRNEVSIMAQTCLKAATELGAASGKDVQQVLMDADLMLDWVKAKSGLPVEKREQPADAPEDLPY